MHVNLLSLKPLESRCSEFPVASRMLVVLFANISFSVSLPELYGVSCAVKGPLG